MAIRRGFAAIIVCKVVHRHVLDELLDGHLNDTWRLIHIESYPGTCEIKRVIEARLQLAFIFAFSQFLVEEDRESDLTIGSVLDVINLEFSIESLASDGVLGWCLPIHVTQMVQGFLKKLIEDE